MTRIKKLSSLESEVKKLKKRGKTVGLITGCFDILHIGHIELLRFAKSHVDYLLVGLENDLNINLAKGNERPIYNSGTRAEVLLELKSVNRIFIIEDMVEFKSSRADSVYKEIYRKLKPDYLFTCPIVDSYWKNKKKNCQSINIKFITYKRKVNSSSTKLIQKLEAEL